MFSYSLKQSKITEGFWKKRMEINAEVTMKSVAGQFQSRFAALECKKNEEMKNEWLAPWDSDVAKWLEAAAYVLAEKDDGFIRERYETAVKNIVKNQMPCGYFNSFFQTYRPEHIFSDRGDHELYCAGHIFEAAAAAYENLGDDRLLKVSEKYADYIRLRFVSSKDAGFTTPGHEEIELALLRLYSATKREKYLELARFFVNERGKRAEKEANNGAPEYSQSAKPAREQKEAEGHAVRALYLYTAMADLAKEDGDEALKAAAETLFEDITRQKMYITGGVGSVHIGERFSCAYDLINYSAYAETCAAIAMALFSEKMFCLTGKAKYAAAFERALYNGILAGESLSGDEFFYVNPLEMQLDKTRYNAAFSGWREAAPIASRVKLFYCSCCPPNLCRFIARLGGFLWYGGENNGENSVTLAQPISSCLDCGRAKIRVQSGLPYNGKVRLTVDSLGKKLTLRVRKPEWCDEKFANERDGFLIYDGVFGGDVIEIDFAPRVRAVHADARVFENGGKAAFTYGPLVLCAEGADHAFPIAAVRADCCEEALKKAEVIANENLPYAAEVLLPAAAALPEDTLYSFFAPKTKKVTLKLIPYFAWGNRGENDMRVWFPCAP